MKPLYVNQLRQLSQIYGGQKASLAITAIEQQIPDLVQGLHAWRRWTTHALEAQTSSMAIQNWVLGGSYCSGSTGSSKAIKPSTVSSKPTTNKPLTRRPRDCWRTR